MQGIQRLPESTLRPVSQSRPTSIALQKFGDGINREDVVLKTRGFGEGEECNVREFGGLPQRRPSSSWRSGFNGNTAPRNLQWPKGNPDPSQR
ncbi:hypothetical protein FA15DRAFT_130812 [Coprinopsis marcescibilis]|uniref:Uncharacterized protein n=1 Tax=Coprinopsis marcescibilis TaxID=230819 RepID=A0A5C3KK89_COPMA|nr:hypothetical protein FA15DRAFT_130812 [Coprinopsis marcescibilis]